MNLKTFRAQDYCDCTLVKALDRLAREADIIDCCADTRTRGFTLVPAPEWPWVFLHYRRFDPGRGPVEDDSNSPLGGLRRAGTPVLDEAEAARLKTQDEQAEARRKSRRAFEDAVWPLIEALRAGHVVTRGFRDGCVVAEDVDPARWSMAWIISREGDTAQVEFFTAETSKNADVILNGLRLTAPAVATGAAPMEVLPSAAAESQAPGALAELRALSAGDALKKPKKRGGGPKPTYDWIAAERALAAKIHADGVPKPGDGGQADLENCMADWFAVNGPMEKGGRKIPAESSIREHVELVLTEHRKALL